MLPGGGCALPGLQDPLTGSHSVGPRKRSAAGRWYQARYPWYCRAAAAPYPAYRFLSQAHTPQARQAQRRRAMASGPVPLILPGGGCALPGLQAPLTGSHSVGPRKRSAAGRWY
ncbi:hypothetical protein FMJ59_05490 [Klebsiella pneumoniae]|nr:hypothetical protein [Klebsiella pneumoniae]PXH97426.1 hypothetical protein DMQ92_06505 [Klebsiella pneumoniae]HBX3487055.1 hypothetical protein [Klebsiella pneumoniae]HBX7731529.1 hypothetical protein [Klebsiella pneumoniae]HBY0010944.1 hypothetical protein [Klebsiella pneumoniae]